MYCSRISVVCAAVSSRPVVIVVKKVFDEPMGIE